MAQGYARASGKPGVVLVTSGPGATNVVTPMQDALCDGTPLVVFCGQVPTSAIGTDAFQEADVIGISRACTKWNVMVRNVAELPRRINEAFEIATSGRPGPVLVDLPKDVTAGILRRAIPVHSGLPVLPSAASIAAKVSSKMRLDASIKRVAHLVNIAKKPIIYAGQGVIERPEGPELLKMFAEKAKIPVTTTLQGLGGFDELDPKSLHMLGMHGSAYANLSIQEADLIIALGARFDDRVTGNVASEYLSIIVLGHQSKLAKRLKANNGPQNSDQMPKLPPLKVVVVSFTSRFCPRISTKSSKLLRLSKVMSPKTLPFSYLI